MPVQNAPGKIFFVLLLITLLAGCRGRDSVSGASWENASSDRIPLAVEVVPVEKARLYAFLGSSGTVRGKKEARIVSTSHGMVSSFSVSLGQKVKKGDVILRLDDELAFLSAEQARTKWEIASADLEALRSLYERGNASRVDLERARSGESGARAVYDQSLRVLEDRTVRSPMDGHIIGIDEDTFPGNYLNAGTMVAVVADISGFSLMLELGERQIGRVGPGAGAKVYVNAAGKSPFSGVVEAVAAGSSGPSAVYQVYVSFSAPSESGVKPGMAARVVMEANLEKERLIVPSSALLKGSESANAVFLLSGGHAVLTPVEVSERHGDFTAVTSGLEDGDLVIVSGTRRLMDGAAVNATKISLVRDEISAR